ncbi:hypothetical protein SteCoe_10995 [Stentor coeruleus]|uniref:Uncharacterized protein n=1 Tax=Stentor coeruleus TaxID=5963 RepID=A0A1R2CED4_9CILI|nr:hypothetical protein SteCoe_10995 [Stentor coeruleus]
MSVVARMFGKLALELEKGLIPAMYACENMLTHELKENANDFSPLVSELLKYKRTSRLISKLVKIKSQELQKPLTVPESSLPDLRIFLKQCLIARDMKGLNAAIHIMWHSFPNKPFPYAPIANTLLSTKPLGTDENKKLWRTLASEMTFYALPMKFSSHAAKNFLRFYATYPENYLPLIKYAFFYLKRIDEEDYEDSKNQLIESTARELEYAFKLKGKSGLLSTNKPIKINYTTDEETYNKAMSLGCVPLELEKVENEEDTYILPEEEIDDFINNFRNDFVEDMSERAKEIASDVLSKSKWYKELSKDHFDLRKEIVDDYTNAEYEDDELIFKAFTEIVPREQDVNSVIEWFECQMRKGISLNIPMFVIESIVINAAKYKKNEFLCLLFNEYSRFSDEKMTPILMVKIITIISEIDCEGEYVEAANKIIQKFHETYRKGTDLELDVFTFKEVRDAVMKCYLKDKRPSDGAVFFLEIKMTGKTVSYDLLSELADALYEIKDVPMLLMLKKNFINNELYAKVKKYINDLDIELDKIGIVYETHFLIKKYYKQPSQLLYKTLSRYSHPFYQISRAAMMSNVNYYKTPEIDGKKLDISTAKDESTAKDDIDEIVLNDQELV